MHQNSGNLEWLAERIGALSFPQIRSQSSGTGRELIVNSSYTFTHCRNQVYCRLHKRADTLAPQTTNCNAWRPLTRELLFPCYLAHKHQRHPPRRARHDLPHSHPRRLQVAAQLADLIRRTGLDAVLVLRVCLARHHEAAARLQQHLWGQQAAAHARLKGAPAAIFRRAEQVSYTLTTTRML